MICGLKTATGGRTFIDEEMQGKSVEGSAAMEANVKGVTVAQAQGEVSNNAHRAALHEIHAQHAFIVAYRLKEISYNRKSTAIKYDKSLADVPYAREVFKYHGVGEREPREGEAGDILSLCL